MFKMSKKLLLLIAALATCPLSTALAASQDSATATDSAPSFILRTTKVTIPKKEDQLAFLEKFEESLKEVLPNAVHLRTQSPDGERSSFTLGRTNPPWKEWVEVVKATTRNGDLFQWIKDGRAEHITWRVIKHLPRGLRKDTSRLKGFFAMLNPAPEDEVLGKGDYRSRCTLSTDPGVPSMCLFSSVSPEGNAFCTLRPGITFNWDLWEFESPRGDQACESAVAVLRPGN